jgi:hypothetical protein
MTLILLLKNRPSIYPKGLYPVDRLLPPAGGPVTILPTTKEQADEIIRLIRLLVAKLA